MTPTRPRPGARRPIDDKTVIGIVGPAFSGESKAADPIFNEAGLVDHHASATNPALADQRLEDLPPGPRQRRHAGPGCREVHQETLKAKKVFVVDDASEYGKGLADIVKNDLGSTRRRRPTRSQQKQTDFSPTVTKIKAAAPTRSSSAATTPRPACWSKQLGTPASRPRSSSATASRTTGFIEAAGAGRRGHDHHLPVPAPDKAGGTFVADYKKAFNADPATYSRRGLRRGQRLPRGHRGRQDRPRGHVAFVNATTSPA